MPVLLKNGRAALAKALKDRVMHLAVGTGDASWDDQWDQSKILEDAASKDTAPKVDLDALALKNEIGRRLLHSSDFVVASETGDIVVVSGVDETGKTRYERYEVSEKPTPDLYLKFHFDFEDGGNAHIREEAVYIDTVMKKGVKPATRYLTPSQIADSGDIVAMNLFRVVYMSGDTRSMTEFVLSI